MLALTKVHAVPKLCADVVRPQVEARERAAAEEGVSNRGGAEAADAVPSQR